MKTYKFLTILFLSLILTNCEEFDAGSENSSELPLAVAFSKTTDKVFVEETNPVYLLEVQSTRTSTVDRTVNVTYNATGSTNLPGDYTFNNTVVIPAGSYVGHGTITFNFNNLALGVERKVVFDLEVPGDDYSINTRPKTTITYTPLCELNQVKLTLKLDQYPGETDWEVLDASSAVVASGGPYATANATVNKEMCLADGNYTLIIYDSYGDGFCCAYGNGSYSLTVNGTVLFNLPGSIGYQVSHNFTL